MLSEDKNQGNLTRRVHKAKRDSPQKQGLPGKKKGDRENPSPVYGGHDEYEDSSTSPSFELFLALLLPRTQAAARNRREALPRLLRVTSPPMWSITTGGRSGNLATNSSFPPMLST